MEWDNADPDRFSSAEEWLAALSGIGSPSRWTTIVDVHVLLRRPDRLLLVRRAGTGYCDGAWSPPCGRLRPLESVPVRAIREAREALAVEIAEPELRFAHVTQMCSDSERLAFFFAAWSWQGRPVNAEPREHDAVQWFPLDRLPRRLLPCAGAAIRHYRAGRPFSLFNWWY